MNCKQYCLIKPVTLSCSGVFYACFWNAPFNEIMPFWIEVDNEYGKFRTVLEPDPAYGAFATPNVFLPVLGTATIRSSYSTSPGGDVPYFGGECRSVPAGDVLVYTQDDTKWVFAKTYAIVKLTHPYRIPCGEIYLDVLPTGPCGWLMSGDVCVPPGIYPVPKDSQVINVSTMSPAKEVSEPPKITNHGKVSLKFMGYTTHLGQFSALFVVNAEKPPVLIGYYVSDDGKTYSLKKTYIANNNSNVFIAMDLAHDYHGFAPARNDVEDSSYVCAKQWVL